MTEMDAIARPDLERLSAFLDGELSPAEVEKLEARLATDKQLSGMLEALRATTEAVGSLPEVRLPRSFALTEEMVPTRRAYPILQLSTAVAALSFVLVVGADLLIASSGSSAPAVSEQALFAADQLDDQQLPLVAATAPAEAPEAIVEEAEGEVALPTAAPVGEAEDATAQEFFESYEDPAGRDLTEERAAEPEVAAGGIAQESAAESEAAGQEEIVEDGALKADSEQEASLDDRFLEDVGFSDQEPSTSISLLRAIEIGLAAALIVLLGLTLWVRQRG